MFDKPNFKTKNTEFSFKIWCDYSVTEENGKKKLKLN